MLSGILVGLGFYLTFNIVLTYTIGTMLRFWTDKKVGRSFADDAGIPIAAGLIVDGGIYRHEFVAEAVIAAILRVQLDTEVPIVSVVVG